MFRNCAARRSDSGTWSQPLGRRGRRASAAGALIAEGGIWQRKRRTGRRAQARRRAKGEGARREEVAVGAAAVACALVKVRPSPLLPGQVAPSLSTERLGGVAG